MGGIPGTSLACATCKKRKIKCDLEQPECRRCIKRGLPCPGYPGRDFIPYHFAQSGELSKKTLLEPSQPAPDGNSTSMTKRSQLPVQPPVICPSIEFKLLDVFPQPKKPMRYDWNIYFNHYRLYTSNYAFPFNAPGKTTWFFNMAQQSPIVIDVLAACGAFTCTSFLLLNGKSPQARKCLQDALQLKHQSVASLKKLLDNPSPLYLEAALAVVANLILIGLMNHDCHSLYQANFSGYLQNQGFEGTSETLEMHITGIKTMVKLLGGFDSIDHKLKMPIYSCGNAAAFSGNMTQKFPMSPIFEVKTERHFSELVAMNHDIHSTPLHFVSGLINTMWFASLDPRLQNLIHSYKWIVLTYEGILHINNRFNSVKDDYLTLCEYRLLDFDEDPLTPFEDTIRLTIVLYSVVRLYTLPPQQCERFIITYLQPKIKETSEQIQKISPDLWFWVLWVAVLGSVGLGECHEFFVQHLLEVAFSRGIKTWPDASNILERFLFVDRGASEPGKAFWNSVQVSMHGKFS